jgi:hypothetical protein
MNIKIIEEQSNVSVASVTADFGTLLVLAEVELIRDAPWYYGANATSLTVNHRLNLLAS